MSPKNSLFIEMAAIIVGVILLAVSIPVMINGFGEKTIVQTFHSETFTISKSGDDTLAYNNYAHTTTFSGSNSSQIIQNCIDYISNVGGGSIYISTGIYTITYVINITCRNLIITGDFGAQLTGTILPIIKYIGHDFETPPITPVNIKSNIIIENLDFYYTGSVTNGNFLIFKKLETDNIYGASFILRNLNIHSNQLSWPTNYNFIGLYLEDIIGGTYENLQIYLWGTALKFKAGWNTYFNIPEDSEHNSFNHIICSMVGYGIVEDVSSGGHIYYSLWDRLKINQFNKDAFIMRGIGTTMTSPDFGEPTYTSGIQSIINMSGGDLSLRGGGFSGAHDYGILATNARLTIVQVRFASLNTAIYVTNCYVTLSENQYTTVSTKLTTNTGRITAYQDPILTSNSGLIDVTGAVNIKNVAHGLCYWPQSIVVTLYNPTGTADCGKYNITYVDATWFTIAFEIQPGANTWRFYWYATLDGIT